MKKLDHQRAGKFGAISCRRCSRRLQNLQATGKSCPPCWLLRARRNRLSGCRCEAMLNDCVPRSAGSDSC